MTTRFIIDTEASQVSIVNRVVTHWSDLTDLDNSINCV